MNDTPEKPDGTKKVRVVKKVRKVKKTANPWSDLSEDALSDYEQEKAAREAQRAREEAAREAARREAARKREEMRLANPQAAAKLDAKEADPTTPDRVWDTPDDHKMSKRAKRVWQVAIFGPLIAAPVAFFLLSPFGPGDTVKHTVSAMGCQFADLFDMTEAEKGQPGYYEKFDEDGNGVACENIYAASADGTAPVDTGEGTPDIGGASASTEATAEAGAAPVPHKPRITVTTGKRPGQKKATSKFVSVD